MRYNYVNEQYLEYCFRDFELLNEYRKTNRKYIYGIWIGVPIVLLSALLMGLSENSTLLIVALAILGVYGVGMIVFSSIISRAKTRILRKSAETMPQDEDGKLRLQLIEFTLGSVKRTIPLVIMALFLAVGVVFLEISMENENSLWISVIFGVVLFLFVGASLFISFRYSKRRDEIVGAIQKLQLQNGKNERQ